MTAYSAIADSEIDPESPGTTTLFGKLRNNPLAQFEKSSGAPVLADDYIVNAMIATDAVNQDSIGADAVSASEVNFGSADVTVASWAASSVNKNVPEGIWWINMSSTLLDLEVNINSVWVMAYNTGIEGVGATMVYSDGSNMRLNPTTAISLTIYGRRIA